MEHYSLSNEHRHFTKEDWKYAIMDENTLLGYNDWVHHMIESNTYEWETTTDKTIPFEEWLDAQF